MADSKDDPDLKRNMTQNNKMKNDKIHHYKIYTALLFIACSSLMACQPQSTTESSSDRENTHKQAKQPSDQKYLDQFEQWKKTQNPDTLQQYQNYFSSHLKQAPTLYELTFNSHPLSADCAQFRFSLPSQDYWKNLLPTLELIEKLQLSGLFEHYKIVSVYRSKEANDCVHGAKGSKHLKNYAVDFQTLDAHKQPYANTQMIEQQLCHFWRKEGKSYALGLGVYGKQRFHIDTQGYRTWGIGFKSVSSPCITQAPS